ncbi:MAG: DNA-3-methyladenine glycosylase I [Hyphomicrobiaceae bacterium]
MLSFADIRKRAEGRKGGAKAFAKLLPPKPKTSDLTGLSDDRALAAMVKQIFRAGFNWGVIDKKWPGFEEAFLGFVPATLLHQPDEYWDGLTSDTRIVRHAAKIMSVRDNARFVAETAGEHGSFGKFLAAWPGDDVVGLWAHLAKHGSRLGGATGQYVTRFLGKDAFIASGDVVACLRDAGLDIAEKPTSQRDLKKIQEQMNAWAAESGLPLTHVSRICAMSIGRNYDADADAESG